ncbi:MAG: SDR family NAD(P)-dependent oxidoreductase [Proteobacteria bacterium]|nr:SDR family NAD(P)-dependent oxidoreductase [Pseudomonadota bacterium]
MTDLNGRTWLVLGASSSVARAFARLVAESGAAVLLAGRDHDDLGRSAADLTAAMEADPALATATIEATYTGAVGVLLGLAPLLEAGRRGHVVVLGSVAGDRGRLKNYVYGSAKAGLAVFTAGLRNRLFRSGVLVTTVKPGFLDTAMTWGLPGMFLVASPEAAARACLNAALKGREVIYTPAFWALIMLIIRLIPERIFKRLSI